MKEYPSIPRDFREFDAYVFDKLDGSNIRAEWSRKRGFYKFGARHRMIDATDLQLGAAVTLFEKRMAETLSRLFHDLRYEGAIAFAEFWGPGSLGGYHEAGDAMRLTLFDVDVYRRGLLPPDEFRRLIDSWVPTPAYFGKHRWTRGFIERVRWGEIDGVTYEGVVGKGRIGRKSGKLVMAKAKTQRWIEAIRARYAERAQELIDS